MDHYQPLAELIGFRGINADFLEEMLPNADNPVYLTGGNNILIQNGKIGKMRGTRFFNDITSQRGVGEHRAIVGIHTYEKYNREKRLVVFTPSQAEYLSADDGFSDIGATNGSASSVVSAVNMDDRMIFTLSDDPIVRYWDGLSFGEQIDSALIRSRFLLKRMATLFLVRPLQYVDDVWVERHQEVWPSFPGNPADFDAEDRLMLESDGAINGCRMLEDSPIIYFGNSIHRVYYVSDEVGFGSMPITDTLGLLSPKTLTGGPGAHFFLSKKGMMGMSLGSVPVPLSWQKFNKLIVDGIDPLYYDRAAARYFDDTGLLVVIFPPAGQAASSRMLIYDTQGHELVGKRDLTSKAYSSIGIFEKDLKNVTPDERRAYGVGGVPLFGTSDGYLLEQTYTGYQQLGAHYVSSMELPPIFFGDRHRNKRLMQADLLIEKDTDEAITFHLELANEANVVATVPYVVAGNGGAGIRRYEVPIDVFGKEFRPVLKDSSNVEGFKVHGILFRGYVATQK